ncbi:MAG: ATP-binding protein [Coriobacteriales bacterium]|nr:ATP-binding protein [Coriobacteriales bacterium]
MDDRNLIDFVEQISGGVHARVEENLGEGFVRLRSAEAERRQAKHDIRHVEDMVIELLRNARDAGASHIFVASQREEDMRLLTVLDDGSGIPAPLHQKIFEPRVTSKLDTMVIDNWGVHGRGMALYSIASNALAVQVAASAPRLGTAIALQVDTTVLPERRDQSTHPSLARDEAGQMVVVRGPHNIQRCVAEFALATSQTIDVYLGTAAQVAATLLDTGQRSLSREELLLCKDVQTLPLSQRLAVCGDAADLTCCCASLGLAISERTAHRILAGQIQAQQPYLRARMATPHRSASVATGVSLSKDSRGLKLAPDDLAAFSRALEQAFETLAERYYLNLADLPKISVRADSISVRFPIEKEL